MLTRIGLARSKISGGTMASTAVVGDTKTASVKWLDAKGNEATVDTADKPIVWASSNEAVMAVVGNGNSATVTMLAVGAAQLTCTADADRDAGEIRDLVAMEDVTVIAAEAVAGSISLA
jgi:uncharacterized protein YjdB